MTKNRPSYCSWSSVRRRISKSLFSLSAIASLCASSFLSTADADLIVNSARERDEAIRQIQASQFLSQTTFGPTWDDINDLADEIDRVGKLRAFENWIDEQIAIRPSLVDPLMVRLQEANGQGLRGDQDPLTPGFQLLRHFREHAIWERSLSSPDQLRQRMANALSQILVVGENDVLRNRNGWRGTSIYHDLLINNAFGNYRNLLKDITYSPAMGHWLDSARNQKTSVNSVTGNTRFPDENFAREFLQLFTVGVFRLNEGGQVLQEDGTPIARAGDVPDELYDNETIQEFAKIFTGLIYQARPGSSASFLNVFFNFEKPMIMNNNFHEPGPKVLLRGVRTPGGNANGVRDIRLAINNAFDDPNCPPFISRLLIQRFTTSNPSVDYVQDVVDAFKGSGGRANRGDLEDVLKAILLHPEARESLSINSNALSGGRWRINIIDEDRDHGSLREPFTLLTSMLRAFDVSSQDSRGDGRYSFTKTTGSFGQFPTDSPSVFNFYLPDHQPIGRISRRNLVAPEFEILTPTAIHNLTNVFYSILRDDSRGRNNRQFVNQFGRSGRAQIQLGPVLSRIDNENDILNYLNILLCHGTIHNGALTTYRREILRSSASDADKAEALITTILASPDFVVNN